MATTTSNFSWPIPQSTDLVKDGATAIASLGSGIDTSMAELKGGTTGQVLSKASNTDMDFTWIAVDPLTILDAKGDLISATAADTPARLAVGTNGQILTADSTTSTGLKWATPTVTTNEALAYYWTDWSPSNNTGTMTTAPSTGTSSGNTTNISASNSSGTVTITFASTGFYLVNLCLSSFNAASYDYEQDVFNIGGTATRYTNETAFNSWGEGDYDGDFMNSPVFLVKATAANQTLTVQPQGRVSRALAASNTTFKASLAIVSM